MDRLLSNCEMVQLMWDFAQTVSEEELDKLQQIDRFQMIAAAQLAKTDKEWVEVIERQMQLCQNEECSFGRCNFTSIFEKSCMWWQSRRKEIGL